MSPESVSSMFSELSEQEIRAIADQGAERRYPKNAILINEGDRSEYLYVILEGQVKVFVSDDKGREAILNIQGAGECFGELALIDDEPRSASVVTLRPSRLSLVSRLQFQQHLSRHPEITVKLLRALVGRVRDLTDLVKNLSLNDVYGRVVRTLQRLATEKDGYWVVEQRLTHQDLADMVGASREMVSRIMKDLTTGGYIETNSKIITIRARLPSAW